MHANEEATDEALIEDYNINKNVAAFRTVHMRYADRLTAAAVNQLCNYPIVRQEVDEIIQNVFLDLHRARGQFNSTLPHSTVHAFLFNRTERRTKDYLRRCLAQRRDSRQTHQLDSPKAGRSGEGGSKNNWLEQASVNSHNSAETRRKAAILVTEMLDSLPEDEAVVMRLRLDGHTLASVAETLGLPMSTVQSRDRTARKRLQDRFGE